MNNQSDRGPDGGLRPRKESYSWTLFEWAVMLFLPFVLTAGIVSGVIVSSRTYLHPPHGNNADHPNSVLKNEVKDNQGRRRAPEPDYSTAMAYLIRPAGLRVRSSRPR